jgi:hypothetical protein
LEYSVHVPAGSGTEGPDIAAAEASLNSVSVSSFTSLLQENIDSCVREGVLSVSVLSITAAVVNAPAATPAGSDDTQNHSVIVFIIVGLGLGCCLAFGFLILAMVWHRRQLHRQAQCKAQNRLEQVQNRLGQAQNRLEQAQAQREQAQNRLKQAQLPQATCLPPVDPVPAPSPHIPTSCHMPAEFITGLADSDFLDITLWHTTDPDLAHMERSDLDITLWHKANFDPTQSASPHIPASCHMPAEFITGLAEDYCLDISFWHTPEEYAPVEPHDTRPCTFTL